MQNYLKMKSFKKVLIEINALKILSNVIYVVQIKCATYLPTKWIHTSMTTRIKIIRRADHKDCAPGNATRDLMCTLHDICIPVERLKLKRVFIANFRT